MTTRLEDFTATTAPVRRAPSRNLVTLGDRLRNKLLSVAILSTPLPVIAFLYLIIIERQRRGLLGGDLRLHLQFAIDMANGADLLPHPLFHLCASALSRVTGLQIGFAAEILLIAATLVVSIVLLAIIHVRLQCPQRDVLACVSLLIVMFLSSIYVPMFSLYHYVGQWSSNVFHNPTTIFARSFALPAMLCFSMAMRSGEIHRNLLSIALSLLLFLGALAKPNFAIAFVVAAPIFLLWREPGNVEAWFRTGLTFAPLIAVLWWQCVQYQVRIDPSGLHGIVVDVMGVANVYSRFPPLSWLLLIAFPLAAMICIPEMLKDRLFVIAALTFAVATIQYWTLAESGHNYAHSNFAWGMIIISPLLFAIAMAYFVMQLQKSPTRANLVRSFVLAALLALHGASGALYMAQLLLTPSMR
jgi:hypothetical protein